MREPFEVPAGGDDIYRYFVIPTGFAEDIEHAAERSWYRPARVSGFRLDRSRMRGGVRGDR